MHHESYSNFFLSYINPICPSFFIITIFLKSNMSFSWKKNKGKCLLTPGYLLSDPPRLRQPVMKHGFGPTPLYFGLSMLVRSNSM